MNVGKENKEKQKEGEGEKREKKRVGVRMGRVFCARTYEGRCDTGPGGGEGGDEKTFLLSFLGLKSRFVRKENTYVHWYSGVLEGGKRFSGI